MSVGIDYSASRAYIALASGGKLHLVECLTMERMAPRTFLDDLQRLMPKLYWVEGGHTVYIEQPLHLSRALEMAMMASRLEAAFLLSKVGIFEVHYVHPSTWRAKVLGSGRANKQDAIDWAAEVYSYKPSSLLVRSYEPDHNYCEALAIAHYGEMQNAIQSYNP